EPLTLCGWNVRLRGEAATATCHGSARYVPKVGSRDPRTEPRVWNFSLRKNGGEWKIDNARVERGSRSASERVIHADKRCEWRGQSAIGQRHREARHKHPCAREIPF